MSEWGDLLDAALLGTQRRAWTPPATGPLAPLLAHLPAVAPPEQALLTAAALAGQMQRAGFAPPADATPLPDPAPAETRPLINATAAAHLHQILHGGYSFLLREWLDLANGRDLCAPPEMLPALLDAGGPLGGLRPQLAELAGARGRWLAAYNPAWQYAVAEPTAADWPTLDAAARVRWLRRLRQADPAAARALLLTTWKTESADNRVGFLHTFRDGLTADDAPFLEQCLRDRSTNVQAVAAGLLAHLPQSALVARLTELLADRLLWDGERLEFDLTQPPIPKTTTDAVAALARADILATANTHPDSAARAQLGAHAWRLCHMLACVPPTVWSARFGQAPAQLVAAAERGTTPGVLLLGWQRALGRHPDPAWAAAVLTATVRVEPDGVSIPSLYALAGLAPTEQEHILRLLLPTLAAAGPEPLFRRLRDLQHSWSEPFASAVGEQIGALVRSAPPRNQPNGQIHLPALAAFFPPSLADLCATWRPAHQHKGWQAAIEQFSAVLHFRRAMRAALAEDAPA